MEEEKIKLYNNLKEKFAEYGDDFIEAIARTFVKSETKGGLTQKSISEFVKNNQPIVTTLEFIRSIIVNENHPSYYSDLASEQGLDKKDYILLIPNNFNELIEPMSNLKFMLKNINDNNSNIIKWEIKSNQTFLTVKSLEEKLVPFGLVTSEILEKWKTITFKKADVLPQYFDKLVQKSKDSILELEEKQRLVTLDEINEFLVGSKIQNVEAKGQYVKKPE